MLGSMSARGWNATAHLHAGEGRDPERHAHLRLLRKPSISSLRLTDFPFWAGHVTCVFVGPP